MELIPFYKNQFFELFKKTNKLQISHDLRTSELDQIINDDTEIRDNIVLRAL